MTGKDKSEEGLAQRQVQYLFLDVGMSHVVPPVFDSAQTRTQYILSDHCGDSFLGDDFILCHSVNSDQK